MTGQPYDWLRYDCMSLWLNQAAAACGLDPAVLGGIITDATQMARDGGDAHSALIKLLKAWPEFTFFQDNAEDGTVAIGVRSRSIWRRPYVPVAFWRPR